MAKTSMRAREAKRKELSVKTYEKRMALKEIIRKSTDFDVIWGAQVKLQSLPRDSSKIRLVNRCNQCSRPHAVYRKFGLCRICLRNHLMQGDVPGGRKSSW